MQVQSLNIKKNQPSFRTIYQPKNVKWNKDQKPIVNEIKKALKEPLEKYDGKSAEKFFETKGLDFKIFPSNKKSVFLFAYKDMKKIGGYKDDRYTHTDKIEIGEYGENYKFKISDINFLTTQKYQDGLLYTACVALLSFVITTLAFQKQISGYVDKFMPTTEIADSTANKTKSILSDSVKVIKPIKNVK